MIFLGCLVPKLKYPLSIYEIIHIHISYSQGSVMNYELYRRSAIGMALTDTLDELVKHQQLTPNMAMKVLFQFDKSISEFLSFHIKSKGTLKSNLSNYRFCDDVWTFNLKDSLLKLDDEIIQIPKLKIVACNGRKIDK